MYKIKGETKYFSSGELKGTGALLIITAKTWYV